DRGPPRDGLRPPEPPPPRAEPLPRRRELVRPLVPRLRGSPTRPRHALPRPRSPDLASPRGLPKGRRPDSLQRTAKELAPAVRSTLRPAGSPVRGLAARPDLSPRPPARGRAPAQPKATTPFLGSPTGPEPPCET